MEAELDPSGRGLLHLSPVEVRTVTASLGGAQTVHFAGKPVEFDRVGVGRAPTAWGLAALSPSG